MFTALVLPDALRKFVTWSCITYAKTYAWGFECRSRCYGSPNDVVAERTLGLFAPKTSISCPLWGAELVGLFKMPEPKSGEVYNNKKKGPSLFIQRYDPSHCSSSSGGRCDEHGQPSLPWS